MGLLWKDFFANGWGPGYTPGTGSLGNVVISGLTAVVFRYDDDIPEHEVPGREGGKVERVGSRLGIARFNGFFSQSGAEGQVAALAGYTGTAQSLSLLSFISGNMFFSGVINVTSFQSFPSPGYSYPFYKWLLEGKVSGVLG